MKSRTHMTVSRHALIDLSRVVCGNFPLLFVAGLILTCAPRSAAESFPLPPWNIYGQAFHGTWDGSSTSPDNLELTATLDGPGPPPQSVVVAATNSQVLLQITPATTYSLTFSAMTLGSGTIQSLMLDGTEVITNVAVGGAVWTRYTNVFRTGGPDDPRVGGDLNLQIFMQKLPPQYGTATATFTNLQLQVSTTRPVLSILQTPEGNVQLRWATNFDWYIPQITIDLQAGVWTALTNQPFTAENQLVLEVGQDTGPHFFRLCQP